MWPHVARDFRPRRGEGFLTESYEISLVRGRRAVAAVMPREIELDR